MPRNQSVGTITGPRLTAREREAKIVDYRARGWSWRQISAELGMSVRGVRNAFARAAKDVLPEPSRVEVRNHLVGMMEDQLRAFIAIRDRPNPVVQNGQVVMLKVTGRPDIPLMDQNIQIQAGVAAMRLVAQWSKMLGLDAASRLDDDPADRADGKTLEQKHREIKDRVLYLVGKTGADTWTAPIEAATTDVAIVTEPSQTG